MIAHLLTPTHVAILLLVLLLIYGPGRLPQTGRALGRSVHEFKEGLGGRDTLTSNARPDAPPETDTDSHRVQK